MKKRIATMLLCVCILLTLTPAAGAAEPPLNLIAVGDLLPSELINTAAYYGSAIYVPYWLFTGYGLRLSYTYSAANSTACLSTPEKQLYFDLSAGKTYDGDAYQYSVSAIMRGGTVYLPLSFVSSFFGSFSYKNIGGNEYGSILRIHTGREVLTDEEFLRMAKPAMKRYYASYYQTQEANTPTPTPVPGPNEGDSLPHAGDTAALGLEGIPSRETLEMLNRLGMTACFFLTAEDVRSNTDLVRRLICSGFSLGALCPEGTAAEFSETAALLWEAARVPCVLALLPEGAEVPPGAKAVYRTGEESTSGGDGMAAPYSVTSALNLGSGDTTALFPCDAENETALHVLVYYLRDQGFAVRALRETDEMP